MALLSDRDAFDRLTCQRIRFADTIGKLTARVSNPADREAIEKYAAWRAYDDETLLDSCFVGVTAEQRQEIIDAVNGIWDECRP